MKELQIKLRNACLEKEFVSAWFKKQNTYSIAEFNKEIKNFFNEHKDCKEFYLNCDIGTDDKMILYPLDFSRNKIETVQDALFNHAIISLEHALDDIDRIRTTMGINALLNKP